MAVRKASLVSVRSNSGAEREMCSGRATERESVRREVVFLCCERTWVTREDNSVDSEGDGFHSRYTCADQLPEMCGTMR